MKIKFSNLVIATSPFLWFMPQALAEGHQPFGDGAHGVNRVIRTNNGYTGVSTKVDNLSQSMQRNEANLFEEFNPATNTAILTNQGLERGNAGTLDLDVMPFPRPAGTVAKGNKPSAYIGGQFPAALSLGEDEHGNEILTQVDAGIQFEPVTLFQTYRPGWSVFLALHGINGDWVTSTADNAPIRTYSNNLPYWMSIRILDGNATVQDRGVSYRNYSANISGTIKMQAQNNGSLSFYFSDLGTNEQDGTIYANPPFVAFNGLPTMQERWYVSNDHPVAPWGDADHPPMRVFNANSYNLANIKRVTAMTRDARFNDELDGSQIVAEWSDCKVSPRFTQKWRIQANNVTADLPLVLTLNAGTANLTLVRGDTAGQIRDKLIATGLIQDATVSAGLSAVPNSNSDITIQVVRPVNTPFSLAAQGALSLPAGYTLGGTREGGQLRKWEAGDVNQSRTGYDSHADRIGNTIQDDLLSNDMRYQGRPVRNYSKKTVEFGMKPTATKPAPTEDQKSTLRREVGDSDRYSEEIVKINLRMLARPVGSSIK